MAEEEEDNSHNGEDDINGDSPVAHSVKMTREGSLLRREEHRRNRMARLHLKRIIETQIIAERMSTARDTPVNVEWSEDGSASFVAEVQKETEQLDQKTNRSHLITQLENLVGNIRPPNHPLEVRLENITYTVKVPALGEDTIGTVLTSSPIYIAMTYLKRLWRGQALNAPTSDQHLLKDINLVFKPGKSYLVLGHPAAGQSWLLRLVAGLLRPHNKSHTLQGSILYNGTTLEEKQFHIENMFAFIDQLDKHAPRFTVQDTFEFANKCKRSIEILEAALNKEMDTDMKEELETAKRDNIFVQLVLIGLGLDGVKDTFVGDADVRGVSGGQRRRVTVGEMMGSLSSILCGDEISNGLDAASTYDMIQVLAYFATFRNFTRLISLLQASPETISLFDEIILMAKGQVIFAGPVHEVEDYFAEIGFICPPFVDIGEFLLMVSSEDNSLVFEDSTGDGSNGTRPSISELAERFRTSILGKNIRADLQSPSKFSWESDNDKIPLQARRKYANNFFVSTGVIFWRFFTLWRRDKRVIMAGTFKNIIMGVSVGGTYLSTRNVQSISGALFQAVLFVVLGAMQSASSLIPDRVIFYKHTDANFYSAWPFVFGRSLSQIPQTFSDTTLFATLLYFMIGLADRDSAANFFVYLSLLFAFAILMNQQLAVFASFADAGALSAYSACIVLILVLFGGFIIPPNTIPNYFQWLYWWNPFAWVYRSLMVNEFRSGRWSDPDTILENAGFMDPSGEPFSAKWIAWGFVYMVPYSMLCCTLTALGLTFVRNTGGGVPAEPKSSIKLELSETDIRLPFKPVTLSFRNISYEVVASTSKETLTLLNDVNGMFKPGRMCCLMGTSGAGKTTLMDVIALRKQSGTIKGKVCLNGWPQDTISFRRCSGYVEQFDVQTPELTVQESVLFSAKLRLDPALIKTDADVNSFVDQVMEAVELAPLAGVLVGTDETFGLSFEQKKRLSIAIELAASPSILFLDEPTSGLDSRSAMIIVRALRRIADAGRTICATIHQPSSSVFEMFDDLLLLKKGGRVVYYGELGNRSCSTLVAYLESKGAPRIELGDNPADWMLRSLGADGVGDLADVYRSSPQFKRLEAELETLHQSQDIEQKIQYDNEYPTTGSQRRTLISYRLNLIYWRSPAYNLARLLLSVVIAVVLGSSFVVNREDGVFSEVQALARLSVIFLSFIITGIMAIISVLPAMSKIRDMYYRHHDAGMYDSGAIGLALGVAEKKYIVGSCFLFCLCFLGVAGFLDARESLRKRVTRSIAFFGYHTFNFAIYSYFGQLFVCLVKPQATALILSSVFIGLNNFFSGLVVQPQFMRGTFYALPYFITPGHYVYNGMVTSLYANNMETVVASPGSAFNEYLISLDLCTSDETDCSSTMDAYVRYFYGGYYGQDTHFANAMALGAFLVFARVFTWLALKYIRFSD